MEQPLPMSGGCINPDQFSLPPRWMRHHHHHHHHHHHCQHQHLQHHQNDISIFSISDGRGDFPPGSKPDFQLPGIELPMSRCLSSLWHQNFDFMEKKQPWFKSVVKKFPQVASRHPTFARFPTSRCGFSFWNLSNSNASWHSLFRFRMWRPWGCRHTLVGSGVCVCCMFFFCFVFLGGGSFSLQNGWFCSTSKGRMRGCLPLLSFLLFQISIFHVSGDLPNTPTTLKPNLASQN